MKAEPGLQDAGWPWKVMPFIAAAHRGPGQVDMEVLGLQNDQRRYRKSSEHCDMGIGLMCLLSTQRKDS